MSQEEVHSRSDEVLEVTRVDEAAVPEEIIARVRELHAQAELARGDDGEDGEEDNEGESGEDAEENEDTSGRDTPSDLASGEVPEDSSEEEEVPVRRPAKAKAKSREVLLWDKLLTAGVPTCPDHHSMRFDIGSEYFEKPGRPRYNPGLTKVVFENKKLAIPKSTGECIEFSFVKVNEDFETVPDVKTFKADANFMRHHSETIAMFSKANDPEDPNPKEGKKKPEPPPSLFTDDPNKMHLRCPRRIFKLMLRLLYNPGAHNKFDIMLFRRDNLEELLTLAGFLKVDAIPAMINGIFPSAYEVYSKVFNYYSRMVNSGSHREVPLTKEEAETLPELFDEIPLGKFSVMSRTELIHVLDRHNLFDALGCIFKEMYALESEEPCSEVMETMRHPKHSGQWGHTSMSAMINLLYDNVMQAKKEADELKPYRPSRDGFHHH